MIRLAKTVPGFLAIVFLLFAATSMHSAPAGSALPDPAVDETLSPKKGHSTIVIAGGCFWGIQAVFEHVKGVTRATAGYSGGDVKNPGYEDVSSGRTGHAESVEIVYDPSKITLGQLLKVFFSVAHDPTELNRQGPDTGTQYRSAIFFADPDQRKIAQAYVDQLNQAKVFADQHPDNPYIARFDLPKVKALQQEFPGLYH